MSGPLVGKWPAVVDSYDGPKRMCRVSVPGVTDGSGVLPFAEIEYPIGDRPVAGNEKDRTELRILPGDDVWVEFERGDPRLPIITGHRLPRAGNPVDWRRWRHMNIETTADETHIINAKNLIIRVEEKVTWEVGGDVLATIGGDQKSTIAGAMNSQSATASLIASTNYVQALTTMAGAINTIAHPTTGSVGFEMRGPIKFIDGTWDITNMTVTFTGCTITSNGKKLDHTHTHLGHGAGANTDPPNA